MSNHIVGKFFFHSTEEHYQTGEVLDLVMPGVVVVRFDVLAPSRDPSPGNPAVLLAVEDLASRLGDDGMPVVEWEFFATREELERFLSWYEAPTDKKPRVVSIKGH